MANKQLAELDFNASELLAGSLNWMDGFWHEAVGLLQFPLSQQPSRAHHSPPLHFVRESTWYALGLLLRNRGGDRDRALIILQKILNYQFDAPGEVYHGTFARAPEEPPPPAQPKEWQDYDPNWREFIGTTLAVILLEYEEILPLELVAAIDKALELIADSTLARKLSAAYTNIALMHSFLLCFVGSRLKQSELVVQGEKMANEIYQLFKVNNTFTEYNSPTYYGVDLYALALWRTYSSSDLLQELGSEMEAELWRDIARYYHAGLKNLCGPYDRSYGINLLEYASLVGLWIELLVGKELAPFPDTSQSFAHFRDFCFVPCFVIPGVKVPAEVRAHFHTFQGTRQARSILSFAPKRVATAWLSEKVMLGAENSSGAKEANSQFYPVTIHWQKPDGGIGWLKVSHSNPLDAQAGENKLEIFTTGKLTFQINVVRSDSSISTNVWHLPGLTIELETTAVLAQISEAEGFLELVYLIGADHSPAFVLRVSPQ